MGRNLINSDETLELACVVKTICEKYKIEQDELCVLPPADATIGLTERVKFKKRIPIEVPIPWEIAPKHGKPFLRLFKQRSIIPDEYGHSELKMHKLEMGLGEFELEACESRPVDEDGNRTIQFWYWNGAQDYYIMGGRALYFIRQKDLYGFIKTLKTWDKNQHKDIDPPVLPTEMLVEIFNNSVGFLLKGKEMKSQYKKYRIPYKRGVLLCGRPGCGKTLTCKWLREMCTKSGLSYRIISMENYREALQRGRVRSLFKLPGQQAGIIFFDDMDIMVQNRKESVNAHELSTFLSELDGLEPTEGIVYVFTTNYIAELDEAFVRPGRIDLWLPFHPPTDKLRKQFVETKFDTEILEGADIKDLVERTKDYTFAEMEEIRKLFCMDLIDEKELNVKRTFKTFDKHRKEFAQRAEIKGFGSLDDDGDDDYGDVPDIFESAPWRRYL